MEKIAIMMMAPGRARADLLLAADRVYYRFATESTEDEGDLPGLGERFSVVGERIIDAMKPRENETAINAGDVRLSLFVDNVARPVKDVTEQGLRRVIDELERIDDAFAFMQGFTAQ